MISSKSQNREQPSATSLLFEKYGPIGAKALIGYAQKHPPRIAGRIEKRMTEIDKAKDLALERLIGEEFLSEEVTPSGQKIYVADLPKIKEDIYNQARRLGSIYSGRQLGHKSSIKTLALLFKDFRAVSKEDYEAGEYKPKDLFYLPKNKQAALNIDSVRQADFHLTLSDVVKKIDYQKGYGLVEGLDYREVIIPLVIYNKNYGNGKRDENGTLQIYDPDSGKYKRFSAQALVKKYGKMASVGTGSLESLNSFLTKAIPNLIASGTLKATDFTLFQEGKTRKTREISSKTNAVSIHGSMHILGRNFPKKPGDKGIAIDNRLAGVVDINGNLKYTFNLKPNTQKEKSTKSFNARQIGLKGFALNELFVKKNGETEEDYTNRLSSYDNFSLMPTKIDSLLMLHGINITDYSLKQQFLIAFLYKEIGDEDFKKIIKNYDKDALKACLSFEESPKLVQEFKKIAQINSRETAFIVRLILRKFNEVTALSENLGQFVKEELRTEQTAESINQIYLNLLQKATQSFSKHLESISSVTIDEVDATIQSQKKEIFFLGALLKSGIKPEEIKEFQKTTKDYGQPYNMRTVVDVKAIVDQNWNQLIALKPVVLAGINAGFRNNSDQINNQRTEFFTFRGETVAVISYRKRKDGKLLASSLNVAREARGEELGKHVLETSLLAEAKERELIGTVHPRLMVGTNYVEKIGFNIVGIIPNYHNTGESLLVIALAMEKDREAKDPKEQEAIKSRHQSAKTIDDLMGEEEIILKYDSRNKYPEFLTQMQRILPIYNDNCSKLNDKAPTYEIDRYFSDDGALESGEDVRWLRLRKVHTK